MLDIITFDKSASVRCKEYLDILYNRGMPLAASQVKSEWCYYIEQALEPTGWRAVWKLCRRRCEKLGVVYPTVVLVVVEQVDFSELTAVVDVKAVLDDIHLPQKLSAPLVNLFPTIQQEYGDTLDIEGTANCLDQLRFFYNHLWRPWDSECESNNWVESHLSSRIELYDEMKTGRIHRDIGARVHSLIQEGRYIYEKMYCTEEELEELEETVGKTEEKERLAYQLVEIHLRFSLIRQEVDILENKEMRKVMARELEEKGRKQDVAGRNPETYLVWLGGQLQDYITILTQSMLQVHPGTTVRSASSLQEALDKAYVGDTVILCPGVHAIGSIGRLEEGAVIKGIGDPAATVIRAGTEVFTLMDWCAKSVIVENVTLDARSVNVIMQVRRGSLHLRNCRIVGSKDSFASDGVFVLQECQLEAFQCEFLSLGTAVLIEANAKAVLDSCNISGCRIGVQMYDNSVLDLKKCSVSNIECVPVRMHSTKLTEFKSYKGPLAGVTGISVTETAILAEGKSELCIVPWQQNISFDLEDTVSR